jgi:hypothetical protein
MQRHRNAPRNASELMGNVVACWISTGFSIGSTFLFVANAINGEVISWETVAITSFWVLTLLSTYTFWSRIREF